MNDFLLTLPMINYVNSFYNWSDKPRYITGSILLPYGTSMFMYQIVFKLIGKIAGARNIDQINLNILRGNSWCHMERVSQV